MKSIEKYILFIFFFTILNIPFSYSQWQEFEKFNPSNGNVDYTIDSNDPNLVYWDESVKNFGLSIGAVDQATLPFELAFDSNVSPEETECINEWNTNGCIQLNNSSFGVYVGFSNDENIFKNNTEFGAAVEAVTQSSGKYYFSVYPSRSLSNWNFTAIFLNKTNEFYSSDFQWTTTEANIGVDYVPFKAIFLHELGHVLGLGHNFNEDYHTVMQANTIENQYVFSLTQTDKDGIAALCSLNGTPTDVKDYIWVTSDLDHFDVNYEYVGHLTVRLIDEDGNGSYIVNWDDLQINASYGCGDVLVYDDQGFDFEIPTLPTGYNWERDANGRVIGSITVGGTDNDGDHHTATIPIAIGNVQNTFITSGILTSSTTYWCGNITLTGSITVPSGRTLIIYPGTIVKFPSNASLIVNGVLNATCCSLTSQSGTSANSWGGILLSGSGASGSSITYANIDYGNEVQVINVPSFTISNCNFLNNYISIYGSGSTGTVIDNILSSSSNGHSIQFQNHLTVTCSGNTITKTGSGVHQGSGIQYDGGSNGIIKYNTISNCNWGVGAIWSSSPSSDLGLENQGGGVKNNDISNCSYGLVVYYTSYPIFGIMSAGDHYGGNSIYNNTKNAYIGMTYSQYSSGLDACYNWWGVSPPNTSLFSVGANAYLHYLPYLSQGLSKKSIDYTTTENSSYSPSESIDSLLEGIELRANKKNKAAMDFFISYLVKHPDEQRAYVELYNCADSETTS